MCIATDKEVGASDRRRRENAPRQSLYDGVLGHICNWYCSRKDNGWKQLDLKKWGFRKRFRKQ